MLFKITSVIFKAALVLGAAGSAVGLIVTGHTLLLSGLLVALGALIAAVIFGFQLAEGLGPDRLSIWVGPARAVRLTAQRSGRAAG